jgi:hypothetical protein
VRKHWSNWSSELWLTHTHTHTPTLPTYVPPARTDHAAAEFVYYGDGYRPGGAAKVRCTTRAYVCVCVCVCVCVLCAHLTTATSHSRALSPSATTHHCRRRQPPPYRVDPNTLAVRLGTLLDPNVATVCHSCTPQHSAMCPTTYATTHSLARCTAPCSPPLIPSTSQRACRLRTPQHSAMCPTTHATTHSLTRCTAPCSPPLIPSTSLRACRSRTPQHSAMCPTTHATTHSLAARRHALYHSYHRRRNGCVTRAQHSTPPCAPPLTSGLTSSNVATT